MCQPRSRNGARASIHAMPESGRRLHAMSTRVHASVPGCAPFVSAQAVADTLGVPVTVAALLVTDLQAAATIEPKPVQ